MADTNTSTNTNIPTNTTASTPAVQNASQTTQTNLKKKEEEEKKKKEAEAKKGLSKGAIAGIIASVLIAIGALVYFLKRKSKKDKEKRRQREAQKNSQPEEGKAGDVHEHSHEVGQKNGVPENSQLKDRKEVGARNFTLPDGTKVSSPVVATEKITLSINGKNVEVTKTPGNVIDKNGNKIEKIYYETKNGYYILDRSDGGTTRHGIYYDNATKQTTSVDGVSVTFHDRAFGRNPFENTSTLDTKPPVSKDRGVNGRYLDALAANSTPYTNAVEPPQQKDQYTH